MQEKLLSDSPKTIDITGFFKKFYIATRTIGDAARIWKQKKQWRRLTHRMFWGGIVMDLLLIFALLLWIFHGIWWPFPGVFLLTTGLGILISAAYYRETACLCPHCHEEFRPEFREAFFAPHTPHTRKVTCPKCHHKGYCVEIYGKK